MKATVYVRLKQEVLDPQGDAVKRALDTLGFAGVRGVRIGKLIEIDLDPAAGAAPDIEQRLQKMADEMLANTVIEDYEVVIGR
jgi:phosphoribosylformylglycinamidine synthase subunit PurS